MSQNNHTQGIDLPSERLDGTRGDLEAQSGGGSTPGATDELRREIILALSTHYYEEYRYDRPNDSVAELTYCH